MTVGTNSKRSQSHRRMRAGFLVPSLIYGGAERWTLDLARFCDSSLVSWNGCVVAHTNQIDPHLLNAMAAVMPVYHDGSLQERDRIESIDLDQAIGRLLNGTDLVLSWEVDGRTRPILDRLNKPVLNVAHRNDPASLRPFVRETDFLATVWRQNRAAFGDEHAHRVEVIPNGIDLNRCAPIRSRQEMRKTWHVPDSKLVVGYLGRIHPQKNCVALGRAIWQSNGDMAGILYGSRHEMADEIEKTMKSLGGDGIQFFPPVEDVGSVLGAIDVFFLPSPAEVCSLSLLEAWAAEVPVVAARVGAVPDVEAEYGPLVIPIDPNASGEELCAAIVEAASDQSHVVSMRARAKNLVWSQFVVSRMANAWTEYMVTCGQLSR